MTAPRRTPAPLPRGARAMLASYREAEDIPPAVRDRIWDVVGAEDAPEPAFDPMAADRRRRRGGMWLGIGLAAAAALLLAWRVGGSLVERTHAEAPPAAVMQAEGEAAEGRARAGAGATTKLALPPREAPADSEALEELTPPEPAPAPAQVEPDDTREPGSRARQRAQAPRGREPDPSASPEPEPAPAAGTLAAERALVAKAWRALGQGNTAGALSTVAEHARRFENGLLAPEREAVETIARCRRGEGDGATRADAFHRAHPRSPLAARVDDACRPGEEK